MTTTPKTVHPDSARERRAALIARVSHEETQEAARQIAAVRALAADDYPKLKTDEYFVDGSATTHTIYERLPDLIEKIELGEYEVVIADEQSRLVRGTSSVEWARFQALCALAGTTIHTRLEGVLAPDDETGELIGFLRNWQNRGEIRRLRHRTSDAKAELARNGKWHHGPLPPGLRREEDGAITKTSDLAPIIDGFRRFADENVSYPQLRRLFTDALG